MNCRKFLRGSHTWAPAIALAFCQTFLALSAFARAPGTETTADTEEIFATNLQAIVVVPRYQDVKLEEGLSGLHGIIVKGPEFLRRPDFEKVLRWHLGFPLGATDLKQIQTEIIKYCRSHDHLVVDVITPQQDITEGIIQLAVIEGKVGKVTVSTNGHKWFSDSVVLRDIRLKPGDSVLESSLNSDLNLDNRNIYQSLGYDGFSGSFRDVSANFKQGKLGETDVEIQAPDRFPIRPFIGGDDTGIEVIGRYRGFVGFNWANVFGLDHRLTYEYVTDTDFDKFREHVGSYVIPLPWRHELTLFGVYADVKPDFSLISPSFANLRNDGRFWQASARYSIPLPSSLNYDHELSAGFDFKRTDTPLLFTGTPSVGSLIRTNNIDVAQFLLGYTGRFKDPWGKTGFSLQGVYSPGGLTEHNNRADYEDFSPGSNPEYLYGRAEIRRETLLPFGFIWYSRAMGQYSDAKLVATETFSLGGFDTVRGYDERIVSGDQGWLFSNELRTPRLYLGNLTGKANAQDWIQPLVFCDYGAVVNREPLINQLYKQVLLSVGAGFRFQVADNLRVRFDYGFELDKDYLTGPNAAFLGNPADRRAHFGLELSF